MKMDTICNDNVTASGASDTPEPAVGGGCTHRVSLSSEYAERSGVLRQAPDANHGVGIATAGSGGDQATPIGEETGTVLAKGSVGDFGSLEKSSGLTVVERLALASRLSIKAPFSRMGTVPDPAADDDDEVMRGKRKEVSPALSPDVIQLIDTPPNPLIPQRNLGAVPKRRRCEADGQVLLRDDGTPRQVLGPDATVAGLKMSTVVCLRAGLRTLEEKAKYLEDSMEIAPPCADVLNEASELIVFIRALADLALTGSLESSPDLRNASAADKSVQTLDNAVPAAIACVQTPPFCVISDGGEVAVVVAEEPPKGLRRWWKRHGKSTKPVPEEQLSDVIKVAAPAVSLPAALATSAVCVPVAAAAPAVSILAAATAQAVSAPTVMVVAAPA